MKEVSMKGFEIDVYRRGLQRAYLDQMKTLMELSSDDYDQSDIKTFARATLSEIENEIRNSIVHDPSMDYTKRIHLEDLRQRILDILEGQKKQPNKIMKRLNIAILKKYSNIFNTNEFRP